MAWNGAGVWNRLYSWATDALNGLNISSSRMDDEFGNVKGGLENCVTRSGENQPLANLPMGSFRHTTVGTASARDHYAQVGQIQDTGYTWGGTAGGTANALTFSVTPAITAYVAGQTFNFQVNAVNTAAATLAVNGLTATAIVKEGGSALTAGDLPVGAIVQVTYNGTNFRLNRTTASGLSGVLHAPGNNLIINGAMRIAQRGTSFAAVVANAYTLDRWYYNKGGLMVHTVTQDTDVPTVAQAGVLFTNSLRLNLTTADIAIAAGEFTHFSQIIEGYNFQRIAQRAFTASFWVKATTAGVYSIAFRNSGVDRSYVSNFTISASATWEYKTIAVSASPSAGTWNYTTGAGLTVSIVLAVGTTYHTTAGAWQTGSFLGTATNINGVNTGATDFRIVGLQVEPGSVATEFEIDTIEGEISRCQRYYWKSFPYATAPAQNTGSNGVLYYRALVAGISTHGYAVDLPALMRIAPTVTFYNPSAANSTWRNISLALDSGASGSTNILSPTDRKLGVDNAQVAGDVVGHYIAIHATADAEL